jgi:uncharacterized protein (TIGR00730 family)
MDLSNINQAFIAGNKKLSKFESNITIFGSARTKPKHPDYLAAYQLSHQLSNAGFNIITGGGPGIMEAANKGAFAGKAQSIGIAIKLPDEQQANLYLDKCIAAEHFFVRKVLLTQHSQVFICFRGGFGTLDELFEILNLMQTGKMPKYPIYLISTEFWQHLSRFIHQVKQQNLIDVQKYFRIFDDIDDVYYDIVSYMKMS